MVDIEMDEQGAPPLTLIDARGVRCPMPLLKLKLALAKRSQGEPIELLVTDEGAFQDIPRYLEMLRQPFTCQHIDDGVISFKLS